MNFKRSRGILATALLALGLSGGASSAATFLFDDTGGNSGTTSLNYTAGDLDLNVTSSGGNISLTRYGLGVHGNPGNRRMSGTESLTFMFTQTVNLFSSIIFERAGGTDDITITDGNGEFLASFTVGDGTFANSLQSVALNLIGDTFVFTRKGGTGPFFPGVRISSLSANAIEPPAFAVVPVPAALPLMLGGFGLLGFVARRRSKARQA